MRPYAPIPRLLPGENHRGLLSRVLKSPVSSDVQRIDLITTSALRVSLIDTGEAPAMANAEGDTTLHILWQADEPDATLQIDGETYPIHPGDTACVPSGDHWQLSPHQVAVLVARRQNHLALPVAPHHGEESFKGHNRCTTYTCTTLQRWKLTGPLTLHASNADVVILSIYGDLALQWQGGIEMLPQAGIRVLRPETGDITLVPNGLSYVVRL